MATTIATEGLQPAFYGPNTPPMLTLGGQLPYGGQVGSGAKFTQGTLLGVISTTAANHIETLTLNGGTGTITCTLVFDDGVILVAFAATATTTQVYTAFTTAIPGWAGNIAVTGVAGTNYIITFINQLGFASIGGGWTAVASTGTTSGPAFAATQGSSAMQWDAYAQATNNRVDGILCYDTTTSSSGARAGGDFGVATNQSASAVIAVTSWYNPADLHLANGAAVDANAYTVGLTAKFGTGTAAIYAALLT